MVKAVASLRELLVVERNGTMVLTQFGLAIQEVAITGVKEMQKILAQALPLINRFVQLGALGVEIFKVYLIPLKLVLSILDKLGPTFVKFALGFHLLNKLLPITTIFQTLYHLELLRGEVVTYQLIAATQANKVATQGYSSAVMIKLFWQKLSTLWNAIFGASEMSTSLIVMGSTAVTVADTVAKTANTTAVIASTTALSTETIARGVQTTGLIVSTTALAAQTAGKSLDAAATIRSLFLDSLSIPIQQAEIAGMTQDIFMRKLKTAGLTHEQIAQATLITTEMIGEHQRVRSLFTQGAKTRGHYASAQALLVESTATQVETTVEIENTAAVQLNTIGMGKRISLRFQSILTKIKDTWTTIMDTLAEWWNTAATHSNTLAEQHNVLVKQEGILVGIRAMLMSLRVTMARAVESIMTWMATGAEWAYTQAKVAGGLAWIPYLAMMAFYVIVGTIGIILTLGLAAAMWLLSVPILILTSPIWLIVLGIAALAAILVICAIKINEQIDVMFYLKQAVMGLVGIFVYFGKLIAAPFIKLGEVVYGVLEGPLFRLGLFFSHIVKMIRWVVASIVAVFTGDDVGSTLAEVLMAPFNAMRDAIEWLVGVLWSNSDSLYNRVVALAKWFDESFGISDKFTALHDAAKMAWDYIKDNMTWQSISATFADIAEGMTNIFMAPINAFKTAWNMMASMLSNVAFTLSIPGFGFTTPDWVPGIGGKGWSWAGYHQDLSLGTWPQFDMEAMAEGGYIQAMQAGGYLVGEKGPELFMPKDEGKLIPNKDLNTQRVRDMLADSFASAPRAGAAANINRVMSLQVENLIAGSANMKRTRMGVDTFA